MVSFAVLASGSGTNFQALIDGIKNGEVPGAQIRVLVTNHAEAGAVERARKANIPVRVVRKEDYLDREDLDRAIVHILEEYKVDYVYLLGYMLLLKSPQFFERYKDRIINLHPAILPSFPGIDAQKQALDFGCKVSGVTIHLVTPALDAGPILYQKCADISGCNSADDVKDTLRPIEHQAVKTVAKMLTQGKFVVEGNRARYAKD